MRYYVFTPGSPGYISAELAIRDLTDSGEARGWAEDWWTIRANQRIISRSEAVMVPMYRDALERWERRDDAVMQNAEGAEILEGRRGTAEREAAEGCRVAAAALAEDDDDLVRHAVSRHGHDNSCGWRFPDEPRPPRRLNTVR